MKLQKEDRRAFLGNLYVALRTNGGIASETSVEDIARVLDHELDRFESALAALKTLDDSDVKLDVRRAPGRKSRDK